MSNDTTTTTKRKRGRPTKNAAAANTTTATATPPVTKPAAIVSTAPTAPTAEELAAQIKELKEARKAALEAEKASKRYWEQETEEQIVSSDKNIITLFRNAGVLQVSKPMWKNKSGEMVHGKSVGVDLHSLGRNGIMELVKALTAYAENV